MKYEATAIKNIFRNTPNGECVVCFFHYCNSYNFVFQKTKKTSGKDIGMDTVTFGKA